MVAGKTGTAQAADRGHKDLIAWFACYAPFDHPRYVVVAMVQGGEHGGSVACPIVSMASFPETFRNFSSHTRYSNNMRRLLLAFNEIGVEFLAQHLGV